MKKFISLLFVFLLVALGADMLFAQQPLVNTETHYIAPQHFVGKVYYGPEGVAQMPAMISGTSTNIGTTVSFGVTFKSAPYVTMQWKEAVTAANAPSNEVWATAVTTTNFTANTTMILGGAYTNFYWMATGLLN